MPSAVPGDEVANPAFSPPVALTIAGFDPSSGAGVSADLQTFAAHGLYGVAAITALTVQSTRGVFEVQPVDAGWLQRTVKRLSEDLPAAGIKVGMLGSAGIVRAVASLLIEWNGRQPPVVVLDPVLRSSSGRELLSREGIDVLQTDLLPRVDCITPNWAELAILSGEAVTDRRTAERAICALGERLPRLTIVATGGEAAEPVDLLRLPGGAVQEFSGTRVDTRSTHGTGCAFSSALLAGLLQGKRPEEAVPAAKRFVEGALRRAPGLGSGAGPMNLLWPLQDANSPGPGIASIHASPSTSATLPE